MPPLTRDQVLHAARRVVRVLEQNGESVCLFGSAACAVYGMQHRDPKDVDLIALDNQDPELVKDQLVSNAPREFFLVPSKDPYADYQVLWYRPGLDDTWRCKVDILVPGLISIPDITDHDIVRLQGEEDLPLVPFITLILLKLKGWDDHMDDHRRYMQEKVWIDEKDIDELLDMAIEDGDELADELYLPEWLIDESHERVLRYIDSVPDSAVKWRDIGFAVDVDSEGEEEDSDDSYYQ